MSRHTQSTFAGPIVTNDFKEQAVAFHREYAGKGGQLAREFDKNLDSLKFKVLKRRFNSPHATRGRDGVRSFDTFRAIKATFATTYFGLMHYPGFPNGPEQMREFDLGKALASPTGVDLIINELFQIETMDVARAKILGFSEETIEISENYATYFKQTVAQKLGLDRADTQTIVDGLISQSTSIYERAFQHFKAQLPIFRAMRDVITQKARSITSDSSDTDYANLAYMIHTLANIQLPQLPAHQLPPKVFAGVSAYWPEGGSKVVAG